jgi:UDP-N-acetylmuramoyl-L-alanyl-D-glutamate--2,6-diaminopimelate ligase
VVWEEDGVHSPTLELLDQYRDVTWVPVPDLSKLVGNIAGRFYDSPSSEMRIVGITGTNGKTSVSQFIAKALNEERPCGVIGTLGNGIYGQMVAATHTTPDPISLQCLFDEIRAQGATNTVMEVSSHGLDQDRVSGVDINVAVFTNLSRDHLDYHGDMAAYADAKRQLFYMPSVKQAVINADDEFGRELIEGLEKKIQVISYGFSNIQAYGGLYVKATHLHQDQRGSRFMIESPWGYATVTTPLIGRFNVSNLLATFATLMAMEKSFDFAIRHLEELQTISGRMERVTEQENQPMVVVDYAHTPDALEKTLVALREHMPSEKPESEKTPEAQLWCVFGCGGDRDKGKRPIMGELAERLADKVIVTNDNPRSESPQAIADQIIAGMNRPLRASVMLDREIAIRKALTEANDNDIILIAGKGHELYQFVAMNKLDYMGDVSLVKSFYKKIELEDFHD